EPGQRALRVYLVDVIGYVGVMAVLFFADPHVIVVLAEPAGEHAAPLGLPLAMELAGATGRRTETRELRDVERRHLEETRPGPIARRHQDRAELLLQRQQFPDEGHGRSEERRV